jgi:hypothetical protein
VTEDHSTLPPDYTQVALRTHVEIELIGQSGEAERLEFEIVPDKTADFYSGFLSQETPLARAILGRAVGSTVPYTVGDARAIRILSVGPGAADDAAEAAAEAATRRKAAVEAARRQSDRTSAMIFASSVEGKWGEYDADHLGEE